MLAMILLSNHLIKSEKILICCTIDKRSLARSANKNEETQRCHGICKLNLWWDKVIFIHSAYFVGLFPDSHVCK